MVQNEKCGKTVLLDRICLDKGDRTKIVQFLEKAIQSQNTQTPYGLKKQTGQVFLNIKFAFHWLGKSVFKGFHKHLHEKLISHRGDTF